MKLPLLLAFALTSLPMYAQRPYGEFHDIAVPGTLEKALLSNPVPVLRQQFGSLTPPGKFSVAALLAGSPPARIVGGLEIQVEGDDIWNNRHCEDKIYIDEEGLEYFEHRLDHSVRYEKEVLENRSSPPDHDHPGVIHATNAEPPQGPHYVPLTVGYYWHEDRFGVYVKAPHSGTPSGPHKFCQFRMPDADIRELLTLVQDARAWLRNAQRANSSNSGPGSLSR